MTGLGSALTLSGLKENLIGRSEPGPAVDFRIDEQWMVETHGAKLLKYQSVEDRKTGTVTLELIYGVNKRDAVLPIPQRWKDRAPAPAAVYAPPTPYEFELTARYTLVPHERRLERLRGAPA